MLTRAISTRGTRATFAAILFFGLLALTARPATDSDLWWHLRTGQWIVETGHVPHVDPFSFTRAGHAWVAHEWLSEVVFYELWKHGGTAALIVFSALVTTAGFMLLYRRCLSRGQEPHWAAAATALGALAAAPAWGVRPQMFTFLLASLLLYLLEAGEFHPRLLLWIPPIFVVWLNLHAGFALAPALLAAYGLGGLLETAFGHTAWTEARPILLRTLLLFGVCLLLIPLNPNGTELYRYPFDTLRSQELRSLIGEWRSPDFHRSLYRPFLLVSLLLVVALASSRSRPRGRVIVLLLFAMVAALDAARHVPIFILIAMPVIAAAIPAGKGEWHATHVFSRFQRGVNVAAILLMVAFALARWVSLARTQDAAEAAQFPRSSVAFLHSGKYPQDLFVNYDWGGYTIWKLYPEYRVFVDGRSDLYGDDLLRQAITTAVELRTGWRDVLDNWNIQTVLIPPSCALAQALRLDPNWYPVFTDSQAVVLLRRYPLAPKTGLSSAFTAAK